MCFLRLLTLICFLLLCVPVSGQQRANTRPRKTQPSPTSTPVKTQPKEQSARVETVFNRFDEKTTVSYGPVRLKTFSGDLHLEMAVLFSFEGQVMKYSYDSVYLTFIAITKDFSFRDDHELVMLIDGERVRFGKLSYKADTKYSLPREMMSTFMSRDNLLKLADAKSAEMRLGSTVFKLEDHHRAGLMEIAQRMVDVPGGIKPLLEVTSLTIDRAVPILTQIKGEFKNISDFTINNIDGRVTCIAEDGSAAGSSSLFILDSSLAPNQTATFKSSGTVNQRAATCTLTFNRDLSGKIPHIGPRQ